MFVIKTFLLLVFMCYPQRFTSSSSLRFVRTMLVEIKCMSSDVRNRRSECTLFSLGNGWWLHCTVSKTWQSMLKSLQICKDVCIFAVHVTLAAFFSNQRTGRRKGHWVGKEETSRVTPSNAGVEILDRHEHTFDVSFQMIFYKSG